MTLPEILNQFSTLLKKGLVEPGPREELVGRIILALVAHKLRSQQPENNVKEFLNELYNSDSIPDLKSFSQEFIERTVTFNHFNAINYTPVKKI